MVHVSEARQGDMTKASWLWTGLVALAYAPALLSLGREWASVPYYSHGFLVPLFAFAAGYGNRDRLVPATDPRSRWAWAVALGLYAFGLAAGDTTLQGLSLVTAVGAWVLQHWGLAGLRTLAFPVLYLVFMVPPPALLVDPFIRWLQLLVSEAAVGVLQAAGGTIVQEGNVLLLAGGEALFVAEACSGITSLITLTPLAVAVAWYGHRRWRARSLVVLSVVPLAMGANLLRVVATTLAVEEWGTEAVLRSSWHDVGGLVTFTLACVGLLAVSNLAGRRRHAARA